jgi:DNA repair protein RadC
MKRKLPKVPEIKLVYRPKVKASKRRKIRQAEDVYQIFMQHWNKNKIGLIEQFKMILLDRKNSVLGLVNVATGGLNGVIADPRIIFTAALGCGASGIILAHNHPSGKLEPGEEDLQITKNLQNAAKTLHLTILDHMILSPEGYYSFSNHDVL